MKKQVIRLLGLAMFLFAFGTMTAQPANGKGSKFFEIDTNNDKMISMSELRTYSVRNQKVKGHKFSEKKFAKRFRKADRDGNGLLDMGEMKRAKKFAKERRGR